MVGWPIPQKGEPADHAMFWEVHHVTDVHVAVAAWPTVTACGVHRVYLIQRPVSFDSPRATAPAPSSEMPSVGMRYTATRSTGLARWNS